MRASRILARTGWVLLAAVAAVGVALAAAVFVAWTPPGRAFVASVVVRLADDAIAGSIEAEGIVVLPHGGVEVRGLRVRDPDGVEVVRAREARVFADVTRLELRTIGLAVELDDPAVDLSRAPGGALRIARAFEPAGARSPSGAGERGWTVRLSRLAIRGGSVRAPDGEGGGGFAASGIALDGRASLAPGAARAEATLRGRLDAPLDAPLSLDAVAALDGEAWSVPAFAARVGDNVLEAVGEGDLARRSGRVAILRLGIDRAEASALVPAARRVGDLGASGFAASDGRIATAALRVAPAGGAAGGEAEVAAAARLPPARLAIGLDLRAVELDPARIVSLAPPGRVTAQARGAFAGTGLADLDARATASVARSVVRGAAIGPIEAVVSADRGDVRVSRLSVAIPGATASGAGRWSPRGAISGDASVVASDLALVRRALESLAGASLPPLAGGLQATLALSGTASAPAIRGTVASRAVRFGNVEASGVRLELDAAGPVREPTGRFDGTIGAIGIRGLVARGATLHASMTRDGATVAISTDVPALGRDPVAIRADARFGPRRESVVVSDLVITYPGVRWALAAPAEVRLGPRVDRAELVAGAQRIAVEGGVAEGGTLDARVVATRVDLGALPRGLLPSGWGLAGVVSGEARAGGTARAPVLDVRVSVAGGAFRGIDGLDAEGTGRWDAGASRATLALRASRAAGGAVEASADLPLPIAAGRGASPVAAHLRVAGTRIESVLGAAGVDVPAAGLAALEATLDGTSAAPALRATLDVSDGWIADLDGVRLAATLDATGDRIRAAADLSRGGATLARLDASVVLSLATVLSRPAEATRTVSAARLEARLAVPGADLSTLAGTLGLPAELAGRLAGTAEIGGTLAAPRGRASLDVSGGRIAGYQGVGVHAEADAGAAATAFRGSATFAGSEVVRAEASLAAPLERLVRADARGPVAVRGRLDLTGASLAGAAGQDVPLSGTIEGRATLEGTLAAPAASAEVKGSSVALGGRPLGDVRARASYAERRAAGEMSLVAAAGGTLRVSASVGVDLGAGAKARALSEAPASVHLVAERLDLGFLAALAPNAVQAASGTVTADLADAAPLGRIRPRGALRVSDGRLALVEYGELTGLEVEAALGDGSIDVTRASARRGAGRLDARATLRGLGDPSGPARLEAHATAKAFTLSRAGQDVLTLDAEASATGTLSSDRLDAKIEVRRATVRLPNQLPREIQSLERRPDIVVGRRRGPAGARLASAVKGAVTARGRAGFEAAVRVISVERVVVRGDSPRVNVDLGVDVTFDVSAGGVFADGSVEVIRGTVEPIRGRTFEILSGGVQFTGGPPRAALLEVRARYDNPSAKVTVTVSGPLTKPEIALSSEPPMDDARIAMLIATGQTEINPSTAAVGSLSGEVAGRAALGAVVTQVFDGLVAGKLPLDTVALDASALRAGKYVGDKVYVGYVRRFDAKPEQGENPDEVRVEYRITRRWKLEMSYGSARSGAASIIWSKDY